MKPTIAIMRIPLLNTLSASLRRTTPNIMNTAKPSSAPKSSASLYINWMAKHTKMATAATKLR